MPECPYSRPTCTAQAPCYGCRVAAVAPSEERTEAQMEREIIAAHEGGAVRARKARAIAARVEVDPECVPDPVPVLCLANVQGGIRGYRRRRARGSPTLQERIATRQRAAKIRQGHRRKAEVPA